MFQRNKKTGLANKVPNSDLEELFRAKLESDSELIHRRQAVPEQLAALNVEANAKLKG